MALLSPGVQVTVIDESQYIPSTTNSVPYILIATAQNKVSGAGVGVAAGTLAANAGRVYTITSQRDLSNTFGVPFFYKTTAGTPINGYELNEYGLLAAYSALGITNQAYVQRADIDLAELTATLTRPTGSPDDGDFWLDTANTLWGLFQWNITTAAFTNQIPMVINTTTDLQPSSTVPLTTIGSIGDYAVVTVTYDSMVHNPVYFKRGGPTSDQTNSLDLSDLYNTWVLVGSDDWMTAWPTVTGTNASPTLIQNNTFTVNGTVITIPATPTVTEVADLINDASIDGVYAAVIDSKLNIYCNSTATADGSTYGTVILENGTGTPLTALGITASTVYYAPEFFTGYSYQAPRWRSTDTQPEPTGSVWQKINNVNLGANLVMKKYNSALGTWIQQSCNIYATIYAAIYALDPSGGGINIPVGTTFARTNPNFDFPATSGLEIMEKVYAGPTIVTGDNNNPGPFVSGNTFVMQASEPGSATLSSSVTVELLGTAVSDFIAAVSAANVPNVSASVNSDGAIVFTHATGGTISMRDVIGTPVATAGFNVTVQGVLPGPTNVLILSSFETTPYFTYSASDTAPFQDPADGRLWYYSATNQADIMIQDDGAWMGYQMVSNDVRGYDLTLTNPSGPIISATAPTTQNDAAKSPLVEGDLWIDTSDLENYPMLYRWQNVDGTLQWVLINNTDQTTSNGILFADARWAPDGDTDPITDPIPTIASLLVSDYLDPDAPDPALYPQGTLLWNTRRSGFNVKSFQVDYFNTMDYPSFTGTVTNAWVTASGNKDSGAPYMGRQAQRALIVAAMKSAIDSSIELREEQRQYNLIACPQYPELIPNMVELNNDRNNTAFVIGDTPLRLGPDATTLTTWATNNSGAGLTTQDGLSANDVYLGVFYPSCQTTDLSGSPVVQPPSHMMIRTIIRSDEVAYPWLAPAGTRRGVIDNAVRIGYVNATTGEFTTLGVNQGLRDVLYQADINPITFVPGVGITNFGNKTATSLTTAMDRINVARLVAFIRGRLQEIGKNFLFEPNDQITRNEISNAVTSLMIDLVNKRGIYDYLVVCDLTNNTPARIDRNELYVDIAIEPVKAVEFIYIPLRIKNTGEIAAGTTATAVAG